jgi:cyclin H
MSLLPSQSVPEIDHADLVRAVADAQPYVASSRQTDLELLYAPSQIALASLSLAAPSLVGTYLEAKHPGLEGQLERDRLQRIIQDIGREIVRSQGESVDMARVKDVDRRLRTCSNPEKIPGSAL